MVSILPETHTLDIPEFYEKWNEIKGWEVPSDKKEVVEHEEGPLWVIAGPGTGKTETLIMRSLRLLLVDGEEPGSIFLVTFTEKGAEQLEDRLTQIIDKFDEYTDVNISEHIDISEMRIGTLHHLCDSIMREYRYPAYRDLSLLDADDQKFFVREESEIVDWVKENHFDWIEDREEFYSALRDIDRYLPRDRNKNVNKWSATEVGVELLNKSRHYDIDLDSLRNAEWEFLNELADQIEKYRETLLEENNLKADFAELQVHFLEFLETDFGKEFLSGNAETDQKPPLKHILVDEYQDTNPVQEKIYFKLASNLNCDSKNLIVVGDDDQSLYRFRGGTVECMLRFGDECQEKWSIDPEKTQLETNYRSQPEIVEWINQYITNHSDLSENARVDNKEPLDHKKEDDNSYPSVNATFKQSTEDLAELTAKFIEYLDEEEIIDDYKEVAILLRSTSEQYGSASEYVDALESKDIPYYNPRSKALTENREIRTALGGLVTILDKDQKALESIHGGFLEAVEEWVENFENLRSEHPQLDEYVSRVHQQIENTDRGEYLEADLKEIYYQLLSLEPLSSWREDPTRAKRLAKLSGLIDSYSNIYGGKLRSSKRDNSQGHLSQSYLKWNFYIKFLQYIARTDFDEPEDPYDKVPSGYVQLMTVHQAKGLEFPVIVAGDLDSVDDADSTEYFEDLFSEHSALSRTEISKEDRSVNDTIRRFYVQYSRAKNTLLLLADRSSDNSIALGYEDEGEPVTERWFEDEN